MTKHPKARRVKAWGLLGPTGKLLAEVGSRHCMVFHTRAAAKASGWYDGERIVRVTITWDEKP